MSFRLIDPWKLLVEQVLVELWESKDAITGPLQVVVEPREQIDADVVDGRPVISLAETVAFAREHYATFESALEMLGRMYEDADTDDN